MTNNEACFNGDPDAIQKERWDDFRERLIRYEVFWARFLSETASPSIDSTDSRSGDGGQEITVTA